MSGRYRLRTALRKRLPWRPPLHRLVPKGADCGQHEWYRSQGDLWACYHCRVTKTEEPRPLTSREREVLEALLATEFRGASTLRGQLESVLATPGCGCGCESIDLQVAAPGERAVGTDAMPVSATFETPEGRSGGVLLFVDDGQLASLEVYAYDDPPAIAMPEAAWLDNIRA